MSNKKKKTTKKKTPFSQAKRRKPEETRKQNGLGRPSLFTEERRELIYQSLREVPFLGPAAGRAGITKRTILLWLQQGGHDYESGIDSEYQKFFHRVNELKSNAETALFGVIKNGSQRDPNLAKYILSCMDPATYGQKTAVKMIDPDDKNGEFNGENLHQKIVQAIGEIEGE